MVTNQSHAKWDAGFHRVAYCGGNSGVGHRNDEVGIDGMFARELAAESFATVIHAAAKNGAVRPREIDMLKMHCWSGFCGAKWMDSSPDLEIRSISPGSISRR